MCEEMFAKANTCARIVRGKLVVFQQVAKHVCEKCAGENCSVQKVAKNVCEKCAGGIAVLKRWQKHVC